MSEWRMNNVLSVVATASSSPAAKHGIVKRRVHASTTGSEPSTPQRIMRSKALRIEVPLPYIERSPLPAYSPSWPIDFIFVVESRRGEIACWKRSAGLSGERVVVIRPWLGERR